MTAWIKGGRSLAALCTACAMTAFAAGCASTSTPASRFYTLAGTAAPAAPAAAARPGLAVDVGPVRVPALVDRPQIVVGAGANEVRLEEFHRWAVPLQEDLARVIADNLLALLGASRVSAFPQTTGADTGAGADYRVAIEVQRFESEPGASAALDAAWTVRRLKDGREHPGRSGAREPVQDKSFEALAAAHSRAAARLSQDIAEIIRQLEKLP